MLVPLHYPIVERVRLVEIAEWRVLLAEADDEHARTRSCKLTIQQIIAQQLSCLDEAAASLKTLLEEFCTGSSHLHQSVLTASMARRQNFPPE